MLKQLTILFLLLFAVSSAVLAQDYIKEFEGIPLISSLPYDVGEYHYDSVKAMGTNILVMTNANSTRLNWAKQRGFKVIPSQVVESESDYPYTYILRYTEARYTKWEAEGNLPEDGLARLSYKNIIGNVFTEGNIKGIVTKNGASADTLIRGPGYRQEIYYTSIDPGDPIVYFVDFRLKITGSGLPTDTICILQVVDSKIQGPPAIPYYIGDVDFIRDTILLRSDFILSEWKTFTIPYNLTELDTAGMLTMANRHTADDSTWLPDRKFAEFIEFKVIWKGDPYTKLYVDNIIVHDQRGNEIKKFIRQRKDCTSGKQLI